MIKNQEYMNYPIILMFHLMILIFQILNKIAYFNQL